MNKKLQKKDLIEASIEREALSYNIQSVLVALSGGADSIATAIILKKIGLNILALHCNFNLRGEESLRDRKFVGDFCDQWQIPLEIKDFDTFQYLKEHPGESVEMACRNLRYEWFYEKLYESSFDRIVTGHNADDNIETFFLNMLRGSGTRGLKGMTTDNGVIWRPLLKLHRCHILSFLENHDINYVVDSSNLQSEYRRNFLRNKVIPLLKEEWKGFEAAMDKTIRNLKDENKFVENKLAEILKEGTSSISIDVITSSPAPLLIIKRFIDPYEPFSTTHEEILEAIKANKPHIRRWRLKKGYVFLRNGQLSVEMSHGDLNA